MDSNFDAQSKKEKVMINHDEFLKSLWGNPPEKFQNTWKIDKKSKNESTKFLSDFQKKI